eukprot:scaffold25905_cov64-Attheya_sp.AAC.1
MVIVILLTYGGEGEVLAELIYVFGTYVKLIRSTLSFRIENAVSKLKENQGAVAGHVAASIVVCASMGKPTVASQANNGRVACMHGIIA